MKEDFRHGPLLMSAEPSGSSPSRPGKRRRVEISDSLSRAPTSSKQFLPQVRQRTLPEALRCGKAYSWVVIATVNGREVVSPLASMPEAKFKVLEEMKARELNRLKRANSHLALGFFYAREGMVAEAERVSNPG